MDDFEGTSAEAENQRVIANKPHNGYGPLSSRTTAMYGQEKVESAVGVEKAEDITTRASFRQGDGSKRQRVTAAEDGTVHGERGLRGKRKQRPQKRKLGQVILSDNSEEEEEEADLGVRGNPMRVDQRGIIEERGAAEKRGAVEERSMLASSMRGMAGHRPIIRVATRTVDSVADGGAVRAHASDRATAGSVRAAQVRPRVQLLHD